ncbi:MAG: hypothetical protein SPL89_05660 [Clostridia bacterium]|nr:hypothetical protein [Clostridia bacterium]
MNDMFEICGIENDKIIESIRKKCSEKTELLGAPEDMRMDMLLQDRLNADRRWDIVNDFSVTSHRKGIGKIIVALKLKTVKFYKWYVDRLFDQQVEFNHTVWASFYELKAENEKLKAEIEQLKNR